MCARVRLYMCLFVVLARKTIITAVTTIFLSEQSHFSVVNHKQSKKIGCLTESCISNYWYEIYEIRKTFVT